MSAYTEKFKDPRWQKKRLEILEENIFTCCSCERNDKTLNVHHLYYERGKAPWSYPDEAYTVLCEDCHKKWHIAKLKLDKAVGISPENIEIMAGYAKGLTQREPFECKGELEVAGYADALKNND